MSEPSCSTEYFERIYAQQADPWAYASSAYELAKYAATVAALPRRRFGRALEVGCSIGILTGRLAAHCDQLLAVDVSRTAIDRARAACSRYENIGFAQMRIPDEWPPGHFDLLVFSEVLYYLSRTDIAAAAKLAQAAMSAGGVVILVNWLGDTGVAHSGDEAASWFISDACQSLRVTQQLRAEGYRLDVLER